jgi:hypothetical protein
MSDAKLKVDLDASGAVKEAERVEKAMRKVGGAADKVAGSVRSVAKPTRETAAGTQGMVAGFGKALMKVELIKQALASAGRTITRILDEAAGASSSQRETRLALTESLVTAGAQNAGSLAQRAMDVQGTATLAQRQAFVGGLEGTGRRLSDADIRALIDAFAAGGELVFGKGGSALLESVRAGGSVDAAIASTAARRSAGVRALRGSDSEEQAELQRLERERQRGRAEFGASAEIGRARFASAAANSRVGGTAVSALEAGLGVFGLEGVVSGVGGAAAAQNVGRSRSVERLEQSMNRVANSVDRSRRPQVGAQGENAR